MSDFEDKPVDLNDHKAIIKNSSDGLSVRAMLVDVINAIDKGELKPEYAVLTYYDKEKDFIGTYSANCKGHVAGGLAMSGALMKI